MTAAANPQAPDASIARRTPWLFDARLDLLLGAGGMYLLSVPLLFWYSTRTEISDWSLILVSIFTIAINAPHYGATLVRVYDRAEDRHRYRIFAVWLSAVFAAAFVGALHVHVLGSLLLTLYITWTPWHFAGQNYGIALTFLRRSGVPISALAKRLLYASFVLSALIAMLSVHVQDGSANYSAGTTSAGSVYEVLRLGIPRPIADLALAVLAVSYLACGIAGVTLIAQKATMRAIVAPVLLIVTQALWFAVPAALYIQRADAGLALAFAAIWISTCHSLQYLWITSYYARRADSPLRTRSFLWKSLLAGSAINAVPGLIFAPAVLGRVSWDAGLAVLVFAVVNLHHFMLDGAVWKLRDGPVARALLRNTDAVQAASHHAGERASDGRWLRPMLAAVGGLSILVPALLAWETLVVFPAARDQPEQLEASVRRLHWIGRDHPVVLSTLGTRQMEAGHIDAATRAFRSAYEVLPNAQNMNNLAWILATEHANDPARAREAVELATRASEALGGLEPSVLDTLAAAHAATGDFERARKVALEAQRLAASRGLDDLAREMQQRARLYRTGKLWRPQ